MLLMDVWLYSCRCHVVPLRLPRPGKGAHLVEQVVVSAGLLAFSLLVATSRVYLGYHTAQQVLLRPLLQRAHGNNAIKLRQ